MHPPGHLFEQGGVCGARCTRQSAPLDRLHMRTGPEGFSVFTAEHMVRDFSIFSRRQRLDFALKFAQ